MKYIGPKARRCRRLGTNVFGSDKYDRILERKPYGPGKTPRARAGRDSAYAKQLKEKQKARDIYGLSERQFHNLYAKASQSGGETGNVFKQLLECRLDNVIYRAGFALTRLQSRQFAGHGHFLVNGVRVTSPSYSVRAGDRLQGRDRSRSSPVFSAIVERHEKYMPPQWLTVDPSSLSIEITKLPDPDAAEQAVDVRQIIEFYSR